MTLEVACSGKDNEKQSGICTEKQGLILALQVAEGTKPTTLLLGRNPHHWARMSLGEDVLAWEVFVPAC